MGLDGFASKRSIFCLTLLDGALATVGGGKRLPNGRPLFRFGGALLSFMLASSSRASDPSLPLSLLSASSTGASDPSFLAATSIARWRLKASIGDDFFLRPFFPFSTGMPDAAA